MRMSSRVIDAVLEPIVGGQPYLLYGIALCLLADR